MKRSSPFPSGLWWRREWCKATISGLDAPLRGRVSYWNTLDSVHVTSRERLGRILLLHYSTNINHHLASPRVPQTEMGWEYISSCERQKGKDRKGGGGVYDQQILGKDRSLVLLTLIHQNRDFAISRKNTSPLLLWPASKVHASDRNKEAVQRPHKGRMQLRSDLSWELLIIKVGSEPAPFL